MALAGGPEELGNSGLAIVGPYLQAADANRQPG
jgi:hypothetical protein